MSSRGTWKSLLQPPVLTREQIRGLRGEAVDLGRQSLSAGSFLLPRLFSSCGEQALLSSWEGWASLVALEHGLQGAWASGAGTLKLNSCGSWALEHGLSSCGARGMWDLPRPGIEPVSPALAAGFSTTVPPGNSPPFPNSNQRANQRASGRLLILEDKVFQ